MDWSSQLRQRVPVVPKEMLVVFDKQLNGPAQKEQAPLYLNGSPLGTKRKGVKTIFNSNQIEPINLNNNSTSRESPNPKRIMKTKPMVGFPLHGAVQGQTFVQYSSRPNTELFVKPKPRAPSITQQRWTEPTERERDSDSSAMIDKPFHRAYKLLLGNSKARLSTQNEFRLFSNTADFDEMTEPFYTEGAVPKDDRKEESEFEKAYKLSQFLTGKPLFRRVLANKAKAHVVETSANSAGTIKKDKKFSILYEVSRKILKDKKKKKVIIFFV